MSETILIVEDERAVARGLEYGLRAEGFVALCADCGSQAIEMARRDKPALIVLDIRLPDMSGFDVCRRLRKEGMRQPILMLTARDEETDKVLRLEPGADDYDDYIVKPYSLRELVSRIRGLLRRAYGELASQGGGGCVEFDDVMVDFDRAQVMRGGEPVSLTPIEFRLLRCLVLNANRPCSRAMLVEQVWGYEDDPGSERTVDVHMRHLRLKLEANPSKPKRLVTVRGAGYMFERPG